MIPQSPLEKARIAVAEQEMTERFGPKPGGLNVPHWPRSVAMIAANPSTERMAMAVIAALLDPDEALMLEVFADGDDPAYREDFNAILQHILKGKADE